MSTPNEYRVAGVVALMRAQCRRQVVRILRSTHLTWCPFSGDRRYKIINTRHKTQQKDTRPDQGAKDLLHGWNMSRFLHAYLHPGDPTVTALPLHW